MIKTKNILVVDDDDVIRLACELTLKNEGMTVDTAENGKVGIEKLKSKNYDLILLDLMMPEMQGADFLEFVRQYDENIIVIVITGFATIESAVETLKKGAYDYLPKPFTPEELRKVVHKGMERRKLLIERESLHRERQVNLERIAAQKTRMAAIINCMGEGLIAIDTDGNLLLKNAVACELLGIKESDESGQQIKGYLNNEELENWIIEIIEKKKYPKRRFHKEIIFDQEKNKVYSVTLAPVKEKEKSVAGLVLVITDISEERKFEQMKAEFRKLVAVVAHELKAPINAIEGYLDLILKGYVKEKPEKEREYLERSRDKAEKLRSLIEDLLSLTSIESGKLSKEMAPVKIKPVISDIVKLLENEARIKGVKITQNIPDQLPVISGDKNSLTYLFTNLISNAIKYNKKNGKIDINTNVENDKLIISVRDSGLGISEEDLGKIFDEFFRSGSEAIRKITGTGLGLGIANRIAKLHSGEINVESKLGEGSTFTVILPVLKSK